MQQSMNDPKLTLGEVQILGKALLQLHKELGDQPEFQKAFEDAVELGIGGRFEGTRLRSTYIERNVMPLFSRVQAMVYVMDKSIDDWCRQKDAQIESSALPPEQKDAQSASLLEVAGQAHHALTQAQDTIGKVSHQRVCEACGVGA